VVTGTGALVLELSSAEAERLGPVRLPAETLAPARPACSTRAGPDVRGAAGPPHRLLLRVLAVASVITTVLSLVMSAITARIIARRESPGGAPPQHCEAHITWAAIKLMPRRLTRRSSPGPRLPHSASGPLLDLRGYRRSHMALH
jgi:hypothetical protein